MEFDKTFVRKNSRFSALADRMAETLVKIDNAKDPTQLRLACEKMKEHVEKILQWLK